MHFASPLIPATLVRRYKRFLADVVLDDGTATTVAVPNTGSMLGLQAFGSRIWLSRSTNSSRKYPFTLELVEADGTIVGVNTGLPNRIAEEAIRAGRVPGLGGYGELKREQRYGRNSRIDILLSDPSLGSVFVEVKNVHLMRGGRVAEFPDTATVRGVKHLDELGDMVEAGHRGVMLFIVQRADCDRFAICRDLDPTYGEAFDRARRRGVEAWALRCQIRPDSIEADSLIPISD